MYQIGKYPQANPSRPRRRARYRQRVPLLLIYTTKPIANTTHTTPDRIPHRTLDFNWVIQFSRIGFLKKKVFIYIRGENLQWTNLSLSKLFSGPGKISIMLCSKWRWQIFLKTHCLIERGIKGKRTNRVSILRSQRRWRLAHLKRFISIFIIVSLLTSLLFLHSSVFFGMLETSGSIQVCSRLARMVILRIKETSRDIFIFFAVAVWPNVKLFSNNSNYW